MSLLDDVIQILRSELGEGYETADLATLKLAFLKRQLLPKLRELYRRRVDVASYVAAQAAAEEARAAEKAARDAAFAEAEAQAELDIEEVV